jgi:hypothetical protein
MNTHHSPVSRILHTLSQAVIIIPVIVIILALVVKEDKGASQNLSELEQRAQLLAALTTTPAPLVTPQGMNQKSIDLKGPYICNYVDGDTSFKAQIKNEQIYAEIIDKNDTTYFLLKGDCIHKWVKSGKEGEKICEVSQFITLFETLAEYGVLDTNNIMGAFPELKPSSGVTPPSLKTFSQTCKKEEVKDAVFAVPTTITFKEVSLDETTKSTQKP